MIEYVFYYKDILIGGCELLIEKVSRQIIKKGFPVKLLCRTIDEGMFKRLEQSGVVIHQLHNWGSNKELRRCISTDKEVRLITFLWDDFVRVYLLSKGRMKTVLYAVHFHALAVGLNCRFPLVKRILKAIGARSIFRLLQSKRILCMDEQTIRYTQNYFQKKYLDNASIYQIARVPINIAVVSDSQLEKRAKNPEFNILAIARASFPFKGYLLGLVDFIEKLENKNNIHLDIVSYGSDIAKLENKIDALDAETKKLITLHGKTDYDVLDQYYEHAKLYVGMGTTILDAAQRGVICIPVSPYTEKVLADIFFHDDWRALAPDEDAPEHLEKLYQFARNLSSEEYFRISKETRNKVVENYDAEKTTQTILHNFEKVKRDKFDLKVFVFKSMSAIQYMLCKAGSNK